MDAGFVEEGIADGDYRNAKVSAKKDTRWILDLMEADDAAHAEHIYEKRTGYGTQKHGCDHGSKGCAWKYPVGSLQCESGLCDG